MQRAGKLCQTTGGGFRTEVTSDNTIRSPDNRNMKLKEECLDVQNDDFVVKSEVLESLDTEAQTHSGWVGS